MTIFSFIAQLLWSCGIWCLVYLEFIGLCQCLSLGYLLAGNVDLVTIVMEIYGWLFLIVWCGAFGRREIVGVLKTLSIPCLTSSFYFSKLYWTGSLCGGTILFLLFWIYLIFVMFLLDLFTPVYPLCNWVFFIFLFFFLSMNLYYLSKKKKRKEKKTNDQISQAIEKWSRRCSTDSPLFMNYSTNLLLPYFTSRDYPLSKFYQILLPK